MIVGCVYLGALGGVYVAGRFSYTYADWLARRTWSYLGFIARICSVNFARICSVAFAWSTSLGFAWSTLLAFARSTSLAFARLTSLSFARSASLAFARFTSLAFARSTTSGSLNRSWIGGGKMGRAKLSSLSAGLSLALGVFQIPLVILHDSLHVHYMQMMQR